MVVEQKRFYIIKISISVPLTVTIQISVTFSVETQFIEKHQTRFQLLIWILAFIHSQRVYDACNWSPVWLLRTNTLLLYGLLDSIRITNARGGLTNKKSILSRTFGRISIKYDLRGQGPVICVDFELLNVQSEWCYQASRWVRETAMAALGVKQLDSFSCIGGVLQIRNSNGLFSRNQSIYGFIV